MKDWKDELIERGNKNGHNLINYIPFIESLLKKERIRENDYWIGHTLNDTNWTINKPDFEKRISELGGSE